MSDTVQQIPKGYKKTEIGIFPKDWNIYQLGNIADIYDGTHQTPHYVFDGVPFYSVENVTNDEFKYTKYISQNEHKELSKRCKIEQGDILMTRIGSIGNCKLINWKPNASFYVSLALIKPKNKSISPFIYYLSKTRCFQKEVEDRSLQWAIPQKINLGEISQIRIPLPSNNKEREYISDVFFDIESLINNQIKLIEKKKAIKQGVMQDLLTGKQRLPGFSGEWDKKKLGEICNIKKGQLITERTRKDGNIPVIAGGKTPAYFHNKANCPNGAITISSSGANAGFIALHNCPIFASDCSTIEKGENYSLQYLFFLLELNQENIYKLQSGGAQPHVHANDLQPIEVLIPKKTEQTAIAEVLSNMDSEIKFLENELNKYSQIKIGMMQQLLTGKIRIYESN